jgi:hypothetical protein
MFPNNVRKSSRQSGSGRGRCILRSRPSGDNTRRNGGSPRDPLARAIVKRDGVHHQNALKLGMIADTLVLQITTGKLADRQSGAA